MNVPPLIPGYELLRALGGGPMTCVYSARECATDSLCAVKVLREEWQDQSTAIKLLQREARAGLAVRHANLVRVLEAHVTRPPYYLVMELLPGESLRRRLRRDYCLEVGTALWIARQTAAALTALHRAGYLHGDLKPDNIHLSDPGTAVLIDLGFAHRPGENASLHRQGYVLGTVSYLAPELGAGDAEIDFRADMFSFGVTLFEMLAGRLPYPPGNVAQTIRRHQTGEPLDIRTCTEALPEDLVLLIQRLLRSRPEERPRAAQAMQQLVTLEIATLRRRASA